MNAQQPTALREATADALIRGGEVCLVEAGKFQARDVAISDGRIAALPADGSDLVGDETAVIDADGRPVIPGLVDAHTHLDIRVPFERLYPHALRGGTTTVVTESNGFGSYFPVEGPEQLLAATADLPIDVRIAVPPQATYDLFEPQLADEATIAELSTLLERDRVVGVGEISWIYVVGRDSPVEALAERARDEGKTVTAHGAGCSGDDLTALATFADDDHEPIAAEEVIERIENGLHVIGRYGSRDDADAVAGAYERLGAAELSLSSDGMPLDRLVEDGYMNLALRRLVDSGVDPADAVRMGTLNPARHFGIDDRGSLAPGNRADVVVLENLESMAVETVLFEGEPVVRNGEALVEPREYDYPDAFYESTNIEVDPNDFRIAADAIEGERARAIEFVGGMVTRPTTVSPPIEGGELTADAEADLQKAAVYDRHGGECGFVGFVTGFEFAPDAIATTSSMQLPAVQAIGADDAAMARAVRRLNAIGGGWVVVDGEDVVAELPEPIAGSCTDLPVAEARKRSAAVRSALSERSDARVGLASLPFTGVPALKLSYSGYADVIDREIVGLAVDS